MKKFLGMAFAAILAVSAQAYTLNYDKAYSSWTVTGATCATATATQINETTASMNGFQLAGYRITNLDGTYAVYVGQSSSVSATESDAHVGERLGAGSNGVWAVGRTNDAQQTAVAIYCKAASGAGSSGVRVSIARFYFK